jgi:Holliday junction DNA helicase RuvA
MIATVTGVLAAGEGETVVVQTDGGIGYAVTVPFGVFERLPPRGGRVSLYTELVVREDGWWLYGFDHAADRTVFQRLLGASGFGPKLALALLSALGPDRTVRSIRERDIAALSTVSGIGRKKAERLVLELRDRFDDIPVAAAEPPRSGSDQAVRALVSLGYAPAAAEEAVRGALAGGPDGDMAGVVRRALSALTAGKK